MPDFLPVLRDEGIDNFTLLTEAVNDADDQARLARLKQAMREALVIGRVKRRRPTAAGRRSRTLRRCGGNEAQRGVGEACGGRGDGRRAAPKLSQSL